MMIIFNFTIIILMFKKEEKKMFQKEKGTVKLISNKKMELLRVF